MKYIGEKFILYPSATRARIIAVYTPDRKSSNAYALRSHVFAVVAVMTSVLNGVSVVPVFCEIVSPTLAESLLVELAYIQK